MECVHQVRFRHVQYWSQEFKPWNFELHSNAELGENPRIAAAINPQLHSGLMREAEQE